MIKFLRVLIACVALGLNSQAYAAARFWVGSTGAFSDTAHWSATSGGAGGQSVPGTGDTATIDNHASGLNGGTLTIDQNVSVITLTWSTAVGTIDNSGNFNVTVSQAAGNAFNGSGTTARTWTGGSGTYTLSGAAATWTMSTTTNLTNPTTAFSSANIVFSGNATTGTNNFIGGGLTYGNVTFNGSAGGGGAAITGANTYAALTIIAPNALEIPQGVTQTVTSLVANTGTLSSPIFLEAANPSSQATISDASGTNTLDGVSFRSIAFAGGATWVGNNGLDFGRNSGITITPPSAGGGGGGRCIGC
jgi:hypothetical protein